MSARSTSSIRAGVAVAVAVAVAFALSLAAPASAEASECGYTFTEITRGAPRENYGRHWEVTGHAPATLSFTQPFSFRNALESTLTLDPVVSSRRLGFHVDQPQMARSATTFIAPSDGRRWKLQMGTLDRAVTWNVRDRCTHRLLGTGRATETLKIIERRFALHEGLTSSGPGRRGCGSGHH